MRIFIIAVFALLITHSAGAFMLMPTDDGFCDLNTGRNWLSVNRGYFMSYYAFEQSLIGTNYQVANEDDMTELQRALWLDDEEDYGRASNILGSGQPWILGRYYSGDNELGAYFGYGSQDLELGWNVSRDSSDQGITTYAVERRADLNRTAGVVPEPPTYALLILGIVFIALKRRQLWIG